jgi:nucleotide-binding universal stress UspA family protein
MAREPEKKAQVFRRIVVTLGATGAQRAALEQAARFAAELDSELAGVFLEDQGLLHYAGLPFAREFTMQSRAGRTIDTEEIERELRSHAETARRALEEIARQRRLAWNFSVVRGSPEDAAAEAAEPLDLLVVSGCEDLLWQRGLLGDRTRRIAERTRSPVMFVFRDEDTRQGPIGLLVEKEEVAERAAALAIRLAAARDGELHVYTRDGHEAAETRIGEIAGAVLGGRRRHLRVSMRSASDFAALHGRVDYGLLILDCGADFPSTERLERIAETARAPVVVVRAPRED